MLQFFGGRQTRTLSVVPEQACVVCSAICPENQFMYVCKLSIGADPEILRVNMPTIE